MKLKITVWCEDESFDMDKDKDDMLEWVKDTIEYEGGIEILQEEVEESEFKDNKE